MCGIAGILSLNTTLSSQIIKDMTDALAHRGPDAEGVYESPNQQCFLGHRRLSIIDLSSGANQPMASSCGKYTIVFNGEIYNFEEIKTDLLAEKSIQFKTHSDTEVLLEAFVHWGVEFTERLNGMFAVAIYHNVKNQLFLFRDRMGIKPLFYYWNEGVFAFGSELKALTPLTNYLKKFTINKKGITSFLRLGYVAEPETIYNEVKKLPSGYFAKVDDNGLALKTYWQLEKEVLPSTLKDKNEAKKELNNLLRDSIQLRMKSDVPFGVFLSGGIDSSTVAGIAQDLNSSPINTFSIGFKEAGFNESEYAKDIAKHIGSNHHEFIVSYADARSLIGNLQSMYDEPFADASAIPTYLVSKLAKEKVKMVLTGDGGDEQFMGYGMYTWAKRIHNPLLELSRKQIKFLLNLSPVNRYKRVAEMFNYTKKTDIKSHVFSVDQYLFSERELNNVISPQFNTTLEFSPSVFSRNLSYKEEQAFFDLKYYLKDDLLTKVDRASMKASLEARTPLLDHRIVSFSLNLDEKLKIKENETKYLLKQVLYDYIPKHLFDRPKWGFGIPLRYWLSGDLRHLLDEYINEERLSNCPFIQAKEVMKIKKQYLKGADYLYMKLWTIMMLIQWFDHHKQYLINYND